MNTQTLLDSATDMMLQGLEDSVRANMPHGPYRDFYLWGLSSDNSRQELWLNLLGVPQFANLTLGLLGKAVQPNSLGELLSYSVPMNLYLIFEVASDDLAIQLSNRTLWKSEHYQRRTLLTTFNQAMVERLRGRDYVATHLLNDVRDLVREVSGFEQSLIPDKYHALARSFLAKNPGVHMGDLEFALWPRLAMNVETCVAVAQTVRHLAVGPIVSQGLLSRYQSVNTLLRGDNLALSERIHIGVNTILVIPTLAYYIGVIAEEIEPIDNFRSVVDSGELSEALYHAALAVRLLNDLGTPLLTEPGLCKELVRMLRSKLRNSHKFSYSLMETFQHFGADLARLQKDTVHGEFNVALSDLDELSAEEATESFEWRLTAITSMYAQSRTHLEMHSEAITRRLHNDVVSTMINRFVDFHASLYVNAYTNPLGEYTVGV